MLLALTLSAALQSCAAEVAPTTLAAVVQVESGGRPLSVHDDATGSSYVFTDRAAAEAAARRLIAEGHNVDLGLAQINSTNLATLGLDTHTVFDECTNLRAAATLLRNAYASAARRVGAGQLALRYALSAYNSGSLLAAPAYVARVLAAAGVS